MKKLILIVATSLLFCAGGCTKSENVAIQTGADASEVVAEAKGAAEAVQTCDAEKLGSMSKFAARQCYCHDDDYALKVAIAEGLELADENDTSDWEMDRMSECKTPIMFADEPESVNYFFDTFVTTCDSKDDPQCEGIYEALQDVITIDDSGVSPKTGNITEEQFLKSVQFIRSFCKIYGDDENSYGSCKIFNNPEEGCEVTVTGEYLCEK